MIESRMKCLNAFKWLINSLEYNLTDMAKSVGYLISKWILEYYDRVGYQCKRLLIHYKISQKIIIKNLKVIKI